MAEEQLLGGNCRVGFELTDPVTVGSLLAEQVRLGALDRVLQVPHGRDGNMLTRLRKPLEWTSWPAPSRFDRTFSRSWRSSSRPVWPISAGGVRSRCGATGGSSGRSSYTPPRARTSGCRSRTSWGG